MLRRHWMGLALAVSVLTVAGCGSSSSGPSFSGTISDSDAADAGSSAAEFAGNMLSTFNFGEGPSIPLSPRVPGVAVAILNQTWNQAGGRGTHFVSRGQPVQLAAPLLSSTAGCANGTEPVFSGDTADADHDGIPNNATMTINCDTVTNGVTISFHGTIHIEDVTGVYGYIYSIDYSIVQSKADTSMSINLNGSDHAAFTSASASDNLDLTITVVQRQGSNSAGGTFHQAWNASFTPTGAGTLAYGEALPNGQIAFDGNFYVTNLADGSQNFRFDIATTTPLAYSAACYDNGDDPPFTAGAIQGRFNGHADVGFTITYTACDTGPTIVGTGNETA